MVKSVKRAKVACEVTLKGVNSQTPLPIGVCTRAKSQKLKKFMFSSSTPNTVVTATSNEDSDGCYLQLRNRRLERRPPTIIAKKKKLKSPSEEKNDNETCVATCEEKKMTEEKREKKTGSKYKNKKNEKVGDENEENCSLGENELEYEGDERTTRERTPTNSIVVSDMLNKVPKKKVPPPKSGDMFNNLHNTTVPNSAMLQEFFANFKTQNIQQFIEKYNFDPVNDKPLPGRYEWVRIKP